MDDTKLTEYVKHLEARLAQLEGTAPDPDAVDAVPLVPASERPCSLCGDLHDPNAITVTCICLSCGEKRPLVHCGNCSSCTYKALGMSLGPEVAAQAIPASDRPRMPWEEES